MRQMIEIDKLDEMLKKYNRRKNKRLTFKKFVEKQKDEIDWVDYIGVVTEEDFEHDFKKEFIKERFFDLAHDWFKGMEGQVDFGIILDCVKEEFPEGVKDDQEE